ncbi:MAG: CpaF family protein [Actinobacteria bacterium]|nr:CpaF family protein [Actinomycetota bacterium]
MNTEGFHIATEEEAAQSQRIELEASTQRKQQEMFALTHEILDKIIDEIDVTPDKTDEAQKKLVATLVREKISETLIMSHQHLSQMDKQKLQKSVMDEIYGFGPITALLEDETVTEVMVNGCDTVYVEREGKIYLTPVTFRDDQHVYHTIDKIVTPIGRRVDESSPMVDARLADGSRVNVIIPPLAIKGPTITIRKFATDPYVLEDLITFGTLNMDIAKFLRASVKARMNIIISGGTGSGKTTFLNVLSSFISENERIVTIEDAAELQLQQKHVISLESRPANIEGKGRITIRDLVVNTLRMRPDRIIVGEVRSGEALDMLQAMNTGHDGSITTIHANSTRDSMSRLETMVLMSGMELPSLSIREQIASAINLIIQISRFPDGSRKVVKVSEVIGMEGDTITTQDLFVFMQDSVDITGKVIGRHVATGITPTYLDKLRMIGESLPPSTFCPPFDLRGRGELKL